MVRATLVGGVPPRVAFVAEPRQCPDCGRPLSPQKSKTRMLVTLAAGTLRAREIRKQCRHCASRPVAVSQQLAGLAPSGQRHGWDLIVWVGLARYHRHLQREEIRSALARQGLLYCFISERFDTKKAPRCLAVGFLLSDLAESTRCDNWPRSIRSHSLPWPCANIAHSSAIHSKAAMGKLVGIICLNDAISHVPGEGSVPEWFN